MHRRRYGDSNATNTPTMFGTRAQEGNHQDPGGNSALRQAGLGRNVMTKTSLILNYN